MDENKHLCIEKNIFAKFYNYMIQERFLIGLSLIRIALGMIILYNYIIIYFQRNTIYGPLGIMGDSYTGLTLYNLSSDQWYFECIFHLGIVVAILFIIGYKGYLIGILNYILTFSFIEKGNLITDGGDNLMYLLLFYLLFANTTAYFSVDSKKRLNNKNSNLRNLQNMLSNFSVIACIIQVCILYFISGLYQVQGEVWSNGTALYYITQVDVFSNPTLTKYFLNNEYLSVIFTYASILVKLAFPFLILNKNTRVFAVISIVSFHIGIGLFMGLVTFSLTMICTELLLFKDAEYRIFKMKIYKIKQRFFVKKPIVKEDDIYAK